MINKLKSAIERYNMIQSGDSVVVALSGGADSVALLHVMLELREELGIKVSACHVNHNLRGEESNSDMAFVRNICEKHRIELVLRSVDVKSSQKKHQSMEEAARQARYGVFAGLSGIIATGHTASDNAETVLLNLIRGTGMKGLCGIPPIRGNIIRPLILCERSDIEEYCFRHDLSYVTDSTNSSEEFTRNRLRLSLIPLIKQINPSFENCVTRMCENLRHDSDFLERLAVSSGDFRVQTLQLLEKPMLSRIIKELLSNNNISPSNLRISQIIEIIEAGRGKINLEKHKFALISENRLKIETIVQNFRKKI